MAVETAASRSTVKERRQRKAASTVAPTAPTEAASVGVAMPPMMDPSTAMISNSGGTIAVMTSLKIPFFSSALKGVAGHDFGSKIALKIIHPKYSRTNNIPGRKAPANKSPTDTGVGAKLPFDICTCELIPASMSAIKISTVEGGMICPKVPDAQITPLASLGSYPALSIAGKEIRPMVTTVAPTTPVEAARRAPTKITEIPKPPRTFPKSLPIVSSNSSAILERSSMTPMKTKSGTETNTSLVIKPIYRPASEARFEKSKTSK